MHGDSRFALNMVEQNLYDLSPAVRLMIVGVAVALGPLAWIWARHRNASTARRLRVLTLVTLFLTFDLVIFGAFTRLTDSGLGCPDWPGCYGSASPVGAQLNIDAAQSAMPTGPVTHSKAWIEMIHRYLATGVGVLILTLTVLTWQAGRDDRKKIYNFGVGERSVGQARKTFSRPGEEHESQSEKCETDRLSLWWPGATLLWVCLQGAFGALTVTMKLFPAIVTLHLLGGIVLLALLRAQSERQLQLQNRTAAALMGTGMRRFLIAGFVLVWLQIALGGWVSTNYAVLACTDFPACQNSFWPAMDFSQGFTLWRELGAGPDGANISFQALTAIHYVHRLAAYIVFFVLMTLAVWLHRTPAFRLHARWLAGLLLLQVATGVSNVVLGWPLIAAVAHTGGAAALVIVLTGLVFSSRSQPELARTSSLNAARLSA